MKTKSLYRLPMLMGIIAVAGIVFWAAAGSPGWDEKARQRKAEYYFLESQSYYGRDVLDTYVALLDRAHDLDSADLDIAMDYGLLAMAAFDLDSASYERAYQSVKRRFYTNPQDYDIGVMFANMAQRNGRLADVVEAWTLLDSLNPKLQQPIEALADAYLRMSARGDTSAFDKAIGIYRRIQDAQGVSVENTNRMVVAYILKADTASARAAIEAYSKSAPDDAQTAYFSGLQYQYINDYDAALRQLDMACSIDSTLGEAYLARAELYKEMDDSIGYDREVFRALLSPTLDVEPKIEILRNYVATLSDDTTQRPRITNLFEQLQQMHVGVSDLHDLYAYYLYTLDDLAGAAEQFSYSVALNPQNEGVWQALLVTESQLNDTTAIVEYGRQAMELFPANMTFPVNVALAYSALGDKEAALAVVNSIPIDKAASLSAAASMRTFAGDLMASMGDTIQALKAYDEAIQIDPTSVGALNNAAYFMAVQGIDLDKAETYIIRVISIEPNNPTYLDTRAWVAFKRKDYQEARRYIDQALSLYQSVPTTVDGEKTEIDLEPSADVLEHAGDIYFMDGEPDKALE
ncbi:MAG: hypothetical protein K2N16_04840, partial [Muribaculaceae bacterium]|nr:hypothetical protein [Muribaculaceae bacterium]